MARLNVMKTINNVKLNHRYAPYETDLREVRRNSEDFFHFEFNLFKFGYAQGHKAAIAEMKKVAE